MKKTMVLATGITVGYVAGTRAGREKYVQIKNAARRVSEMPTVVHAREELTERVDHMSHAVVGKVAELASHAGLRPGDSEDGAEGVEGGAASDGVGATGSGDHLPPSVADGA